MSSDRFIRPLILSLQEFSTIISQWLDCMVSYADEQKFLRIRILALFITFLFYNVENHATHFLDGFIID